jgi:hypothetical protein
MTMKLISVRTMDSMVPRRAARDTVIRAEVNPGDPKALGSMVWDGYSKVVAEIDAMPGSEARDAKIAKDNGISVKTVRRIRNGMDSYASELGTTELSPGGAGSLGTTREPARTEKVGAANVEADDEDDPNSIAAVDRANKLFWDNLLGRTTHDYAAGAGRGEPWTPSMIQQQNDALWKGRRAVQDSTRREFGKGR